MSPMITNPNNRNAQDKYWTVVERENSVLTRNTSFPCEVRERSVIYPKWWSRKTGNLIKTRKFQQESTDSQVNHVSRPPSAEEC